MIRSALLLALAPAALASAAWAQDPHAGHHMPPARPAPDPHAGHQMPASPAAPADPHAGHMMMMGPGKAADLPVGSAAAPPPPTDRLADKVWDVHAMDRARAILKTEHGGMTHWSLLIDRAEVRGGSDDVTWQGEYRFGGDVNRLAVKSEGEAETGGDVHHAEVQALWSRAVGPYFDVQAGVRQDFEPRPRRTYATLGVEGLAPYWFEVGGALFLSDEGDVSARVEGSYDLRLTNRLILQPALEANLAASDDPATGVGSGLSDVELGLRLRYDLGLRQVAPYVGVEWEKKFGDTADYARAEGEDTEDTRLVAGLRLFF
jgi:copper resistance protein B